MVRRILRHPLSVSLLIHAGLLRALSPGHDDQHGVQWFEGTLELGEAGDGHSEKLHFHREPKKSRVLEAEPHAQTSDKGTADAGPIEIPEAGAAGSGGTRLTEGQRYLLQLVQRLDALKSYPRESLLREEEGAVVLALVISRDGQIQSTEVAKPSPFASLNRAALQAASRLSGLPPLPSEWSRSIRVQIPISYRLDR
jgi:TonB family protein